MIRAMVAGRIAGMIVGASLGGRLGVWLVYTMGVRGAVRHAERLTKAAACADTTGNENEA